MEPIEVTITDYQQMVELFHGETDRGAAVLAGGYVENFLGIYLQSRMVDKTLAEKIFGSNGPLASFSQRIDFAHAFGFLPPGVCAELHLVRRVRNYFAHHPRSASFSESPVREWASSLGPAKGFTLPNGEVFKMSSLKDAYLISTGRFVATIHNTMLKTSANGTEQIVAAVGDP